MNQHINSSPPESPADWDFMSARQRYEASLEEYNAAYEHAARAKAMNTPSFMLRPSISLDGDKWCVLYGENIQDGVAGFGDTPEKAMSAFDLAWKGGAA